MADFERLQADWLSFDGAQTCILRAARPGPIETVELAHAQGRHLAEPIIARATLPPHDNSAMDGFAVRSCELRGKAGPERLPVFGVSLPGSRPVRSVPPKHSVRIMTGGPLPETFDSVIRVEHTDGEEEPGWVILRTLDDLGKHVRPGGQDLQRGTPTIPAGTEVRPGTVAVALACGIDQVPVHKRPRVGVLSSGDELVDARDFQRVIDGVGIPDTNRAMLLAAVAEAGGIPVDLGVVRDDPEALKESLGALPELDALVTTGGASMGERDLFKRILKDTNFDLAFWRAKIRPGSPVSFGHLPSPIEPLAVFGLPGNPASAFVTFHVFVVPYLRVFLGCPSPSLPVVTARCSESLTSPAGLTHFVRVALWWDRRILEPSRARQRGPRGAGWWLPFCTPTALPSCRRGPRSLTSGSH